ncbi:site-specific integrase [uncultured Streptococcus sp.]|uniref:tyrosine-type recombinase/integrase n=1 Tax=uncultured Streptococcus sp. TaxID=83427 RepID=UPI0025D26EB4|nr:site-specific integrase [uncultured Streptococcus sp.]
MKRTKTKYPNIFSYETKKGKRYYVRRKYTVNGQKKEVSQSGLKSLADARVALAEIEQKIDNHEFDTNKNLTVDEYWQLYSDNRIKTGRWAPDTVCSKISIYGNHFKERYGKKQLKDINRLEYEQYITRKLNTLTRQTVVQTSAVFEAMITDAVVNGYLNKNPITRIYIGESRKTPKNKQVSLEDFRKWDRCAREVLDDYYYAMVRTSYFGLRRSEIIGIKYSSLELINGRYRIFLDESRTRQRPEGGRMKTVHSSRYVMVDEETTRLLTKAMATSKKIAKSVGRIPAKDDFLFVGRHKKSRVGYPVGYDLLTSIFEKVNKRTKMHITPHMMRHFFATQGQVAGVPLEHMAAALGHTTSYMTQKYTHIKDEVASDVTDSFLRAIK